MRVVLGDDEVPLGPHVIGPDRAGVGAHLETPAQRAGGHGGGEVGDDGHLARLVETSEVDLVRVRVRVRVRVGVGVVGVGVVGGRGRGRGRGCWGWGCWG